MDWKQLMQRGEASAAWKLSDAMLHEPREHVRTPRHMQRIWDGTRLEGRRVLIRCYHGLGDTIQFIRYVPFVVRAAADVIVWAQPALLDLLSTVRGSGRLLPLHDGVPEVGYDVDVELMELAHVFRTTPADAPAQVPYIHVMPAAYAPSRCVNVGFVWRAGDWDRARSLPFAALAPLLAIGGIRTVALQADLSVREASRFASTPPVTPIRALAEVIAALDLVVTVDTMAAHLAGALGIRTWLLLPADSDWRWMLDRDDTPWYPHTTLYRQSPGGGWEPVVRRVQRHLADLVRARAPVRPYLRAAAHETRPTRQRFAREHARVEAGPKSD